MRSLLTKLTLAFLIVGLVGAILVALLVRWSIQAAFEGFLQDQGQETLVAALQDYYQTTGSWDRIDDALARAFDGGPGGRRDLRRTWDLFALLASDGTVLYSRQPGLLGRTYSGRDLRDAVPITVDGQTVGWLARTPASADWLRNSPEGAFLIRVNRAALLSALIAGALALLLGSLLAYGLTRSLRELKDAADAIAHGQLGRQVPVRTHDELGDLALAFNQMSRDLDGATQARRQMTADIAHDLRTPLSVISGYTEALSDGKLPGSPEIYGVLHQETQYLRRLIDDLRLLSLADAGELPLNRQPLQLQPLLEAAALRHGVAAQGKAVAVRVEVAPDLPPVAADPERLAQVFDNLISNALRHTPNGGEITLRGARAPEGGAVLQVRDTGAGIAPDDLPHVFDRFYRGDKARSGGESGLGLAITRSIVAAHGGKISVESQPGQGTAFTIRLPQL